MKHDLRSPYLMYLAKRMDHCLGNSGLSCPQYLWYIGLHCWTIFVSENDCTQLSEQDQMKLRATELRTAGRGKILEWAEKYPVDHPRSGLELCLTGNWNLRKTNGNSKSPDESQQMRGIASIFPLQGPDTTRTINKRLHTRSTTSRVPLQRPFRGA